MSIRSAGNNLATYGRDRRRRLPVGGLQLGRHRLGRVSWWAARKLGWQGRRVAAGHASWSRRASSTYRGRRELGHRGPGTPGEPDPARGADACRWVCLRKSRRLFLAHSISAFALPHSLAVNSSTSLGSSARSCPASLWYLPATPPIAKIVARESDPPSSVRAIEARREEATSASCMAPRVSCRRVIWRTKPFSSPL